MNTYVLYSLPKGLNLLYYIHEKRTASIILKYLKLQYNNNNKYLYSAFL